MRLKNCLSEWEAPDFARLFKAEVISLGAEELPLQQQLCRGNVALDGVQDVMVLRRWEEADRLHVKAGLFFRGIIAGSCCIDDPTPVEPHEEYCELEFRIDRKTGETEVLSAG